jgi:hypothetical protein
VVGHWADEQRARRRRSGEIEMMEEKAKIAWILVFWNWNLIYSRTNWITVLFFPVFRFPQRTPLAPGWTQAKRPSALFQFHCIGIDNSWPLHFAYPLNFLSSHFSCSGMHQTTLLYSSLKSMGVMWLPLQLH